jgi:hypothetical protein
MSSNRCWVCNEGWPDRAQFCPDCGVELEAFDAEGGSGFLSSTSDQYLAALVRDDEAPYQSALDDDLRESIEQQIVADLRAAYKELGLIAMYAPEYLQKSIDMSRLSAVDIDSDLAEVDGFAEAMYAAFIARIVHGTDIEALEGVAELYEDDGPLDMA